MIVYTCNFWDYDNLEDPQVVPPGVEFICISERNQGLEVWKDWIVARPDNPVKASRYWKMFPHLAFPEEVYTLYMDANMRVVGDVRQIEQRTDRWACFSHPEHQCIYDELKAIARCGRAPKKEAERERVNYLALGVPRNRGLVACGVVSRRHTEECMRLNELWWEEFQRSIVCRDQPPLNKLMYQENFRSEILPGSLWRNEWFIRKPHKKRS